MGDRVVDCARLESVCAARHQGFESPPIRDHVGLAQSVLIGNDRAVRIILALIVLAVGHIAFAQKDISSFTNNLGAAKQAYLNGKFDEALAVLNRIGKGAATVESLDLEGCIYMEQGKFDDAAKAFDSGHISDFTAFAPRIHLADAMLRQKKFAEAGKEYEKLLDLIKSPMWPDYLRFGILMSYLGQHDQAGARKAFSAILFPTETPAYYYAQAAWSFDHGNKSDGLKWIRNAKKIFDSTKTGWFDRALYQFGWVKKKPAPSIDPFF